VFASPGPDPEFWVLSTAAICGFEDVVVQLLLKVLRVYKYFSQMRKAAVLAD
jgi:hypothetical protein